MNDLLVRWYPALFLVVLAGITFWIDKRVQPPPPVRDGSTRHDPDFIIENFSAMRMNPDGSERHALQGSKMTHYPDDGSTQIESPRFVHFDHQTAPVRVTSKRALLSRNGENVYFIQDVNIQREAYADQATMTLTTEYLHVIPDLDLAKTDRAVVMTQGSSRADGVGMEYDNRNRVAKLNSKVKVIYGAPLAIPGTKK